MMLTAIWGSGLAVPGRGQHGCSEPGPSGQAAHQTRRSRPVETCVADQLLLWKLLVTRLEQHQLPLDGRAALEGSHRALFVRRGARPAPLGSSCRGSRHGCGDRRGWDPRASPPGVLGGHPELDSYRSPSFRYAAHLNPLGASSASSPVALYLGPTGRTSRATPTGLPVPRPVQAHRKCGRGQWRIVRSPAKSTPPGTVPAVLDVPIGES